MNSTRYKHTIINNTQQKKQAVDKEASRKSLMHMRNKSSVVPEAYWGTLRSVEYSPLIAMNCVFSYHCNVELLISNHVRVCL